MPEFRSSTPDQLTPRWHPDLEVVRDLAVLDWIGEGVLPWGREVGTRTGAVVPTLFERYARILHPASLGAAPVPWADVARAHGRVAHPGMQWEAITNPSDAGTRVVFDDAPRRGQLPPGAGSALVDVLASSTSTDPVWFAVWEGWGDVPPTDAPRLALPGRGYVVLRGPLATARQPLWWPAEVPALGEDNGPTLWWPDDRSWFVATEIDFRWTYVAGSSALVEAILGSDAFEAFEVDVQDRHDLFGDEVNPLPSD